MKFNTCLLITILIGLFIAGSAMADVVELQVTNAIAIEPPDSLNTEYNGPRLLLQFSLPNGIDGRHIDYAEIVGSGDYPNCGDMNYVTMEVFPITTDWSQGAGWDYPWANGGGDYNEDSRNFYTLEAGNSRSVKLDVTKIVTDWVAGNSTNYGFILIPRKFNLKAYKSFGEEDNILSDIKLRIVHSMAF